MNIISNFPIITKSHLNFVYELQKDVFELIS